MALTLPNIPMAYSPSFSEEPRVRKVQFGDGYAVRSQDGLNPIQTKVSATWKSLSNSDRITLINFFRAHTGTIWFYWTPTGLTVPLKWIATSYSYSPVADSLTALGHRWDLDASFEQVYDLSN